MTIVGARIDNRLLHGIVATTWVPESNATRVMVIDDDVANNANLKEAMKLGRPSCVAVSIINKETALKNFSNHKYDRQRVYILSKTPQIFLELIKLGEKINKLILGGTITYPNSIKISNRAYIKPTEIEIYKNIYRNNTEIVSAYTTNDKQIDIFSKIDEER
ncbi:PTS mannose/fructose/sorbose transporter subunit IIB [Bombilactobacillus bombi]|uniref:PTS system mannose/fructose/N-acetylgalactosamine-transporter subunit IIB n=1 Tax=Bombilactobacillus bombi TaxID=1303590 RepID=UPI000E5911A8|nr:PTS sugar transporter subunit IIB [Bombilactobacillus bombi]AXX65410.1 PTS mannose/fructose/sorbose transporter subunit IIB [Bombilactobacillus bombi]